MKRCNIVLFVLTCNILLFMWMVRNILEPIDYASKIHQYVVPSTSPQNVPRSNKNMAPWLSRDSSELVTYGNVDNDVTNTSQQLNPTYDYINEIGVYEFHNKQWSHILRVCDKVPNATLVETNSILGPMLTHRDVNNATENQLDRQDLLSNDLLVIHQLLVPDPDTVLVDIGAKTELFSLVAAKMNRNVIMVEPRTRNIQCFCASLTANDLTGHVTIVRAGISNVTRTVKANIADDSVTPKPKPKEMYDGNDEIINFVRLDDLLSVPSVSESSKIIIHVDMVGHIKEFIDGADSFFQNLEIEAVLMQWKLHTHSEEAYQIAQFFYVHKLEPYLSNLYPVKLNDIHPSQWPNRILWKRFWN